ncbi:MAG: FAD-dependent oxidoreductase [Alphaproteobacteria bacterium]
MPGLRDAEIIVIGGGAIGCSVAYHLTKSGKREVAVLEKAGLTQGATWHAAGLVGQLRGSRNLTHMMQNSVALYETLEAETGQATGWKRVGSLRVASSPDRWLEIKRLATTARSFGFELHLVGPEEAQELFPLMNPEGVLGAAWVPFDGYIDPSGVTQALARGARAGGATFHEGVRVTGFACEGRRVAHVNTDHGMWRCDTLVIAAGMWSRGLGALSGVHVPAAAVEHQYLVTEPIAGAPRDLPTFRDPDHLVYMKPEVGGLAVGGWEPDTVPFGEDGVPADFRQQLLPSNFERFEQLAVLAGKRVPALNEVGVRDLINGPIPVSADGEPILGRAPERDNVFLACGFTAGIAAAGGAGRALAEWIVEGEPGMDLWPFDPGRFGPHHAGKTYLHERAVESYGRYYALHFPGEEAKTGRGGRRSPLYGTLRDKGAVYGSKFGWERPNWFAPEGSVAVEKPSFGRPNWFEPVGAEHRAVRERVALIDQSSFAKFEVAGPGALAAMQRLAAGDLDKPPGSTTYTQLCNPRGGIECDLTISRLDDDRFYIVTGSGFGVHDAAWIRRHLPTDGSAVLREVTSAYAVVNVCGPRARDLLAAAADDDVSNAAFPFLGCREIIVGYARVLAIRLTYVGELGWELHIPTEYAAHVYEMLWQAGAALGVADVGYRAIESLRLEKRYLYWSADITPDYNPYEAGLGFCVALGKGDFIGREALEKIKAEGPRRKLCCFALEREAPVHGGEAILREGRVLGVTTSGAYGYTVGKSIVLGYVPAEEAAHDIFEIEAFGETVPATRQPRALYDPGRERILA